MKLNEELNELYQLFSKLVLIAIRKGLRLIIENPWSKEHYLTKYFPIKAKLIDLDRSQRGDNMKKPTQYWFINCEPKNNKVDEEIEVVSERIREQDVGTSKRSLISPTYARIFIKEFIL